LRKLKYHRNTVTTITCI